MQLLSPPQPSPDGESLPCNPQPPHCSFIPGGYSRCSTLCVFSYLRRNIAIWGKYYAVANGLKINFKFSNYIFHFFHECEMLPRRAELLGQVSLLHFAFKHAKLIKETKVVLECCGRPAFLWLRSRCGPTPPALCSRRRKGERCCTALRCCLVMGWAVALGTGILCHKLPVTEQRTFYGYL